MEIDKKQQIINWCKELSSTQGFYGRLLNELQTNHKRLEELANINFNDIVDFIMYMES